MDNLKLADGRLVSLAVPGFPEDERSRSSRECMSVSFFPSKLFEVKRRRCFSHSWPRSTESLIWVQLIRLEEREREIKDQREPFQSLMFEYFQHFFDCSETAYLTHLWVDLQKLNSRDHRRAGGIEMETIHFYDRSFIDLTCGNFMPVWEKCFRTMEVSKSLLPVKLSTLLDF